MFPQTIKKPICGKDFIMFEKLEIFCKRLEEINQKLCKGLTDEEIEMVSRLIIKVAENAAIYLNE